MGRNPSYADDQLVTAISASSSWRGTLRELGLVATSAGAMRSVRAHADRLGIDYAHFRGQRHWTEGQLRVAIASARTWSEVAGALDLRGGSAVSTVKGHARRLGFDTAHLESEQSVSGQFTCRPSTDHLSRAGSLLAVAWFTLCGRDVAWPLEPCRYDLLVTHGSSFRRVQVKTTTVRGGRSWDVFLSTSRRERKTYDPDEIDEFFIVDGNMSYYVIPIAAVGGLHMIRLSAYERYRVSAAD